MSHFLLLLILRIFFLSLVFGVFTIMCLSMDLFVMLLVVC